MVQTRTPTETSTPATIHSQTWCTKTNAAAVATAPAITVAAAAQTIVRCRSEPSV
jgi:hypothetical protein